MGQRLDERHLVSPVALQMIYRTNQLHHSQNAGQNCIGIERLIVHTSQYDELYAIFTERVQRLRFGSVLSTSEEGFVATVDCGAMISDQRFRTLEKLIADAAEEGANVEVGGKQWHNAYLPDGTYFDGTVVGDATQDMEITQTERKLNLWTSPVKLSLKYHFSVRSCCSSH
jgi:acyl-CoA reductase-like NAD-dependent aldehyde dehydrogenase